MKKKLTQVKALEICRELWIWMFENPVTTPVNYTKLENRKKKWPSWKKYGFMLNDCPCCGYHQEHGANYCGTRCLITWGSRNGWCCNDGSPYCEKSYDPLAIVRLAENALRKRGVKVEPYKEAGK